MSAPTTHDSFLRHIVSAKGISADPAKTAKVEQWSTPTSVKKAQQFLGLASYYRQFIKNFAMIASPLYKLTEKKTSSQWTSHCQPIGFCPYSSLARLVQTFLVGY